jgi:aminoglycoside phosphotransferase (APT) family kinase protein
MTHHVESDGTVVRKRYTSWSRDEPTREWSALTVLSHAAPDLTPTPIATGDHWLTMTAVPGEPLSGSLTPAQLSALGDALDTLWSVPPDELLPIDLFALIERTRTGLALLSKVEGVIAAAADAWLSSELLDLTDVRDPVLAHGDPNLTNYLWDGTQVRIIDFEDAGRGDRTVELANLVEHLSGRDTDWTSVVDRFAVDPERFGAARCLWAGFWLVLIGPDGPSARRNPPGVVEAQARRVFRLVGEELPGGRRRRGCRSG